MNILQYTIDDKSNVAFLDPSYCVRKENALKLLAEKVTDGVWTLSRRQLKGVYEVFDTSSGNHIASIICKQEEQPLQELDVDFVRMFPG